MPWQKTNFTSYGNVGQHLINLKNFLINVAGWSDAGNQTVGFYTGNNGNSNIQFTGVKNASGQIIYFNTIAFYSYKYSGGIELTHILYLSKNNIDNSFITSTNDFFNSCALFPCNTSGNYTITGDIFYDNKSFLFIATNILTTINQINQTIHELANNYKILGYIEKDGYKVLFNDFFVNEGFIMNTRNIVILDNSLRAYDNHIYPFNTLIAHDGTGAFNNLKLRSYSHLKNKITYAVVDDLIRYTGGVSLLVNGNTKITLPFSVNHSTGSGISMTGTFLRGTGYVYGITTTSNDIGGYRYANLIVYPEEVV